MQIHKPFHVKKIYIYVILTICPLWYENWSSVKRDQWNTVMFWNSNSAPGNKSVTRNINICHLFKNFWGLLLQSPPLFFTHLEKNLKAHILPFFPSFLSFAFSTVKLEWYEQYPEIMRIFILFVCFLYLKGFQMHLIF